MDLPNGKKIFIYLNDQISCDQTFKFCKANSIDNSENYYVKVVDLSYAKQKKFLIDNFLLINTDVKNSNYNKELFFYNWVLKSKHHLYFVYNHFPHVQLAKLLERKEINFNQNSIVNFAFNLGKLIQTIHEKNYIFGNLCPLNIYFTDKETFSDIKLDVSPFTMKKGFSFRLENYREQLYYQYPDLQIDTPSETANFIDVHSYGQILYECLFREKFSIEKANNRLNQLKEFHDILELILICTNPNPNERKTLTEILNMNIFKVENFCFELKERDVENDFNLTLIKEGENDNSDYFLRYKATEKKGKKKNKFYEIIKINPDKFNKHALKELLQKEIKISSNISKSDFGPRYEGIYEFQNQIFLIKDFLNDYLTLEEYIVRKINSNEKCILTGISGILLQQWLNDTLYQLLIQAKVKCPINPRNILIIFDQNKNIFGIKLYDFGFLESLHHASIIPLKLEGLIFEYYFPPILEMAEEKYYLFLSGLITYFIISGTHFLKDSNNKALLSQNKFTFSIPNLDQELENLKTITYSCLDYKSNLSFSHIFDNIRKSNNYIKQLKEIPNIYILGTQPESSMGEGIYLTKDNKYIVKKYYIKKVSAEKEDIQGRMTEIKALNLIIAMNSFKQKCKYITQIVDSFQIQKVLHVIEDKYGDYSLDYFYRYFKKGGENEKIKLANMKIVGKCIGKALQFLISKSYIHRNVCPSNIIVKISKDKIDEASLCGFSSCKHLSLKYQMKVD